MSAADNHCSREHGYPLLAWPLTQLDLDVALRGENAERLGNYIVEQWAGQPRRIHYICSSVRFNASYASFAWLSIPGDANRRKSPSVN
ncbi:MAG TPA: hypothetical protein VMV10_19065 [Pirellulales bacterium]|nr:hypothetical protein [Pirellulales bacterium]